MITVLVHPYRYKSGGLEYLLIKRKRVAHNWQGVTGSLERNETSEECAIRELFEETGYIPAFIASIDMPADFYEGTEGKGEIWKAIIMEIHTLGFRRILFSLLELIKKRILFLIRKSILIGFGANMRRLIKL